MPDARQTQTQWMQHIGLEVNQTPLGADVLGKLIEAQVDTSLNLPSMFTLRFHDDDYALLDGGVFAPGAAVKIKFSDQNTATRPVMVGEITALEPEYTQDLNVVLVVRGFDRSHRLNRGTRTRVFVNTTDQEIAQAIASEAGLRAQAESTPGTYDHVFQHNQSDLAFLQARAGRIGFEVFVEGEVLHFRKPSSKASAGGDSLAVAWGSEIRSFYPRLTLARQVDKVVVKGWDPASKDEIVGQAARSDLTPRVAPWENGGGPVTARALSSAADQVVVRRPVASQGDAEALAQAILDEINSGFLEAEGVAFGRPDILAGVTLDIGNLGARFSGKYVVTAAVHVYTQDGYEVHFRVEGARPRLMTDLMAEAGPSGRTGDGAWGGVVPAVVTNNDDPQGMSRVRLKFPWMDDALESDWARVIGAGAGHQRGLYWLPEVNDEVLVAFEHGDFGRPYVVGGLWNGQDAPPEDIGVAVKNGRVETRTLRSRSGHVLRMVDESGSQKIEIIDGAGNCKIVLDAQARKVTITSSGDIVLDSTGKVEIKAAAELNLEAQGNVAVRASGTLTLRGATVNIN